MKRNVGTVDRGIRGVVGILLLLFFFLKADQAADPLFYWGSLVVGLVMLGTAVVGMCPPYAIFGINTCSSSSDDKPAEG
ncbi:DUF2892 domain-containing protein [Pseudomonadota bacterium]